MYLYFTMLCMTFQVKMKKAGGTFRFLEFPASLVLAALQMDVDFRELSVRPLNPQSVQWIFRREYPAKESPMIVLLDDRHETLCCVDGGYEPVLFQLAQKFHGGVDIRLCIDSVILNTTSIKGKMPAGLCIPDLRYSSEPLQTNDVARHVDRAALMRNPVAPDCGRGSRDCRIRAAH